MGEVNERLKDYVSKEINQRDLHNSLILPGLRNLTVDFEQVLGIRLTEEDRPLIESFVAAASKRDPGKMMQDEPQVDRIYIKKGKAVILLK